MGNNDIKKQADSTVSKTFFGGSRGAAFQKSPPGRRRHRREFLKHLLLFVGAGMLSFFKWVPHNSRLRFLRPPSALDEVAFNKKCIRCGQCGEVCPNQCITFFPLGIGKRSGTPFIVPREQGCILCMKCTHVCPSGALQPLSNDIAKVRETVDMGKAELDTNLCYSYNNRVCGICYRACPLQDVAIKIGMWEKPTIIQENCVGCGLCERICYHYPQAIRIKPKHEYKKHASGGHVARSSYKDLG